MATQQSRVTSKELNYISDSFKNEDLLAKLCVQGAVECQDPRLKMTLTRMAQERVQNAGELMNILQGQSHITH